MIPHLTLNVFVFFLLRGCFFFWFSRWKSCAGVWLFGLLCLLYIFQVITLFVFIGNSEEDRSVAVRTILFSFQLIKQLKLIRLLSFLISSAQQNHVYSLELWQVLWPADKHWLINECSQFAYIRQFCQIAINLANVVSLLQFLIMIRWKCNVM